MTQEPTPEKKSDVLDPKANFKALSRIVVVLIVVLGGIWLFLRFTAGQKTADKVTATILRQPIELTNVVENLPAASFKGLPLALSYPGTLLIEATVLKGNDLDIFVIPPDQIENVKQKRQFKDFNEFEAKKVKNYQRAGRLPAGAYYLVLVDSTLGIMSARSSDVKIHARLEP